MITPKIILSLSIQIQIHCRIDAVSSHRNGLTTPSPKILGLSPRFKTLHHDSPSPLLAFVNIELLIPHTTFTHAHIISKALYAFFLLFVTFFAASSSAAFFFSAALSSIIRLAT